MSAAGGGYDVRMWWFTTKSACGAEALTFLRAPICSTLLRDLTIQLTSL